MPIDVWLDAESHPTRGFAYRKGWHCTLKPEAPHLSEENRVWIEVEVDNFEFFERPQSQGGTWVLAQRMKVLRELSDRHVLSSDNKLWANLYDYLKKILMLQTAEEFGKVRFSKWVLEGYNVRMACGKIPK